MSKRKPYIREIKPSWWQKHRFYVLYMLKETTAIPTVWFSLILAYGAYALFAGELQTLKFIGFLQNPLVFLFNAFALVATLFHSKTWFVFFPKSMTIIVKGKKIPDQIFTLSMWALTAIVSLTILILAL